MNITIQIFYTSDYDSKLMQKASFPVNTYHFKQKPDQEAARVAFEWWKLIKHDLSYRVKIEKVIYNGENDITELIKQLDNAPIPDLPF